MTPEVQTTIHICDWMSKDNLPSKRNVINLHEDRLCFGPCAEDPDKHGELRIQYWLNESTKDCGTTLPRHRKATLDKREADLRMRTNWPSSLSHQLGRFDPDKPIVLWSSDEWTDRLNLWWLLHTLDFLKIPDSRIWYVESSLCADRCIEPLRIHGKDQMLEAYKRATPIGSQRMQDGADLWRKFVASNPERFAKVIVKDSRSFDRIQHCIEPYFFFFPRIVGDHVRLSKFDQYMFDKLDSKTWTKPYDIVSALINEQAHRFNWLGATAFLSRLSSWRSGPATVLEFRVIEGVNQLTSIEYRLTSQGDTLKHQGITAISEAPRMFLGGCELYQNESLWAAINSENGWKLVRVELGRPA